MSVQTRWTGRTMECSPLIWSSAEDTPNMHYCLCWSPKDLFSLKLVWFLLCCLSPSVAEIPNRVDCLHLQHAQVPAWWIACVQKMCVCVIVSSFLSSLETLKVNRSFAFQTKTKCLDLEISDRCASWFEIHCLRSCLCHVLCDLVCVISLQ